MSVFLFFPKTQNQTAILNTKPGNFQYQTSVFFYCIVPCNELRDTKQMANLIGTRKANAQAKNRTMENKFDTSLADHTHLTWRQPKPSGFNNIRIRHNISCKPSQHWRGQYVLKNTPTNANRYFSVSHYLFWSCEKPLPFLFAYARILTHWANLSILIYVYICDMAMALW